MPDLPPPGLIETPAALADLGHELSHHAQLGIDTESNSLYAFRERVCLVQIATPDADYLIDALAVPDLAPLAPALADPRIEKILHAAEYDLLTLKRDYGFEFANLFDTMQAARILARPRIGLGDLLAEEFGVEQVKKHQRADWGKRPLTPDMLVYAQLDIHYLIPLRERLKPELDAAGRWPLAEEDFRRAAAQNGLGPGTPELNIWRMTGVRDLSPRQCAILQQLAEYRHARAEERDLPLFKVLGDKTLVAIAQSEPTNPRELRRIAGMSEGQVRRHGRALLKAVQEGLRGPVLYPPRRPAYDEPYQLRLEALKDWRKLRAREMQVESDIVLPRDILENIARRDPAAAGELSPLMENIPWRREQFAGEILATLALLRTEQP